MSTPPASSPIEAPAAATKLCSWPARIQAQGWEVWLELHVGAADAWSAEAPVSQRLARE